MLMKRITLLFLGIFAGMLAWSQDGISWKITLNKKAVLKASNPEDTLTNKLLIDKNDLDNNGLFKIEVIDSAEKKNKSGWQRTIALVAPDETNVAKKDSTSQLFFYNRDLLKLLWARKKLTAYTWTLPPDPAMAAAIRIRRLRLFTVELADQ